MVRVEIDEIIQRPIEEVFDQLVDIPRYTDWMPPGGLFISSTKDSEGPAGAGTAYSDVTRVGTVRGEISAFNRPDTVVFHYTARLFGVPVMDGWPGYTLDRAGEGATRLCHRAHGHLHGPFRLLQPLVQMMARRERQRTVTALKASLESVHDYERP